MDWTEIFARLQQAEIHRDEARRQALLDARARQYAAPPSGARNADTENALLFFRIGDERYALPLQDVREVIRSPILARVPGAPVHVAGLLNLRGRIIPVYFLTPAEGPVIVLRSAARSAALLVSSIEAVREDAGERKSPGDGHPNTRWLTADMVPVLDIDSILNKGE